MTAHEKKLVDVYKRAQQRIFEKVTQTVAKGLPASYQRAMLNAVNRELARLTKQSVEAIEELLEETYAEVMAKAKVNLDNWWKVAKIKGVQTYDTWYKQFTVLNRGAINELIDESVARLQVANAGLAKNLRDVITMKFASGETVDDTKNRIIEELYGSNGRGKLNIKGRNYDPTKYAELVARTATREATNKATIVEAEACGSNLVKMTSHSPTCSVCGPLQGRVYTTDPNNKDYPYLYEHAFKHGYNVVHPHCRHVVNAYIPELMSDDELLADKEHSNKSFKDPGQSKKDIERYMRVQKEQADLWRDTQQYARYKARLGKGDVPKTLHDFRKLKKDEAAYNSLVQQYKKVGQDNWEKAVIDEYSKVEGYKVMNSPLDIPQWMVDQQKSWSEYESKSFRRYTEDSDYINEYLRGKNKGSKLAFDDIENITNAISKSNIDENIAVWRGTSCSNFVDGEALRLLPIDDWFGRELWDLAYNSTSVVQKGAFNREISMQVLIPKDKVGAYINDISVYENLEYEMLLDKSAKYDIIDARRRGGKHIIQVKYKG